MFPNELTYIWKAVRCDKVCQCLATGQWFSPGPPVSPTNKTDRHNIIEILLKVVLNTIKQTSCKKSWNHFRDWIYNQHKMFGQLTNKKFPYYPKMFLLLWMCTTFIHSILSEMPTLSFSETKIIILLFYIGGTEYVKWRIRRCIERL